MTWFKDNIELRDADFADGHLNMFDLGRKLQINNAGVDDSARYSCVARNLAGESEKNFDVNVLGGFCSVY